MDYKHLLDIILANLDEGIIVTDTKANIIFYNEPATNIGGIDPAAAIGKNILDVFPGLTEETSTFYYVLRQRQPLLNHVQHYTNYQGKQVATVTSTIPMFENGQLVGAVEIFKDLTQVVQLSEKILALQKQLASHKKTDPARGNGTRYTFADIITRNPILQDILHRARKVACSPSPILIYGETGTGKELLVQAIHNACPERQRHAFIAQNCAALPPSLLESLLFGTCAGSFTGAKDRPGLFELADGGTLFLDEINSLDRELQAKLLRVLQDGVVRRLGDTRTRTVNVRVIAASNEHPLKLLEEKRLRQDLYYRLNVIFFHLPPLRERQEDIPLLAQHFLQKYRQKLRKKITGLASEVLELFWQHNWPGNVRELEHVIESAINLADGPLLTLADLPREHPGLFGPKNQPHWTQPPLPLKQALQDLEIRLLQSALQQADYQLTRAAQLLGLPKQTLHNKLKKYGLRPKDET
ncbi:sigma-54-dependent Fis family transcriptional regulator [Carboxydocella sp. JDF658]|uniref:sigma-54 interaction domain-containing protein n=1 Tax=Carboxydocella sp. JDF658 TaxID=1926600 RepID=UPI0009C4FC61|nr:sigma 54-interacting transcriptional regulator [Carboxydocella sp. JDF658]GAW30669.1 hypothetical protein JDF658_04340 [Carboxydocella sp. JDF658]